MLITAIDPGADMLYAAVLTTVPSPAVTVYGPVAESRAFTSAPDPLALVMDLERRLAITTGPVVVEVARGSIASGRDADPVLRNNLIAGEITGMLRARGFEVFQVASGGLTTAWNWRTSLGVKGKGAAAKDGLTRQIVKMRLDTTHAPIPAGPRGGLIQDYYDAAGLALAALDRIQAQPRRDPMSALAHVSEFEAHKLAAQHTRKRVYREARKSNFGGKHVRP